MDTPHRPQRRLAPQPSLDDPGLMVPSPPASRQPSRSVSPDYKPKRSGRIGSMVAVNKIIHSMSSLSFDQQDMDAVGWEDISPRGGQETRRTRPGGLRPARQPSGALSEQLPRAQSNQLAAGSRGTSTYDSRDSRKSNRRRREDDLHESEEPRSQRQRREHEESAARSGSTVQGASGTASESATYEGNELPGNEGKPDDRRAREERRIREARRVRDRREREGRGERGTHGARDERLIRSQSVPQSWSHQVQEEEQSSRPRYGGEGHRDPEVRQHGGSRFVSRRSQD
ncbi:hypothetical protein EPUS_00230 [Endocarpon pusillum Z07020]|uniref:Uncharacterized protein n=1 Tax=Endocarpon pusillum (strain Z07020 / HMAS-L-300199) TaxID=1263415 RepID=U1GCX0_ENDPU|nr:uncharacterized protein EPUS_00230 [Endocarpon pusillum Z07020]ERF75437.1 hypothetical protein EPUS_00230 [Endocarpon pusillum Z07020]